MSPQDAGVNERYAQSLHYADGTFVRESDVMLWFEVLDLQVILYYFCIT